MFHPTKFRAWHTENNFWVNGLMLASSGKVYKLSAIQCAINPFIGAEKLLIQYATCANDVTNKLIFDGDIVETPDKYIGVVKWSSFYCGFVVEYFKGNNIPCYLLGELAYCRVIGNICENPDKIPQTGGTA